ncbi:MAG: metallophosphoesterase family protein [Moraxella sp.]|nr:metallophosphoesterase family protein [Moraxella sp.]
MRRTFAIGDIHGSRVALTTLIDGIQPICDDTLIFLGDYVNRGNDSKGVLDILMNLSDVCQTVFIMGNHELIMLSGLKYKDDFDFWLRVGGDKTLNSFNLMPMRSECWHLPFKYVSFLKDTQDYYETDEFIFCHASIYSHLPMDKQDDYALRWRKLEDNHVGHVSGKTVICGHSEQRDGQVLFQNGIICIDTWAYGDGCLTALEVNGKKIYQADNRGDFYVSDVSEFFK